MLDEKSLRLFTAIHEKCGGSYKILEENELVNVFSANEGVDGGSLRDMIFRLEGHRFIDVRYADDGEYCVCALPEGVRFLEEASGERRAAVKKRGSEILLVLLSSFFGGFLGALLALAVTAL